MTKLIVGEIGDGSISTQALADQRNTHYIEVSAIEQTSTNTSLNTTLTDMSHLRYNSYPGFGEEVFEAAHYSTAVRIPAGEKVEISGQGGWDRATSKVHADLDEEINQVPLLVVTNATKHVL